MTTTPEYDAILARKMKEREIKGNISSVKMTPEETAKEIAEIQGGAKSSFDVPREMQDRLQEAIGEMVIAESATPIVSAIVGQAKKKRGRPLGSRNKPKI